MPRALVLASLAVWLTVPVAPAGWQSGQDGKRRVSWPDVAPAARLLQSRGVDEDSFEAYVDRLASEHARRVREGDLDHLVFYLLQSTRFTELRPLEPALSAKALVDSLDERARAQFREQGIVQPTQVPAPVRSRVDALLEALDSPPGDERLAYFRELLTTTVPDPGKREEALLREYGRVMRFVYEKEFVAARASDTRAAVADLYRTRGLSTDTAVEAGYLVHLGLGIVRGIDPDRRIRRVLIVGPGLDLAPRTALHEAGPPESYQPWAVIDSLFALGLSRPGELEVVAADINPRVVAHLARRRESPPTLTLESEIRDTDTVTLTKEFRDYFSRLGGSVGEIVGSGADGAAPDRLRKTVRVSTAAARALTPERLDIVTERLAGEPFDLAIATNILPYFDDGELVLAMSNIAAMLGPGGVFLHNEPRPSLGDVTSAFGLPYGQSRHAVIATVRNAPTPLVDSVFIHRRTGARSNSQR